MRRGFLKALAHTARERGQGLVEFAMITPVVLMFMFVIIDFGIGLNHRVVVTNDAREGARYAATGKSVSQVKQQVQDQSEGLVKDGTATNCGSSGKEECKQVKFYDKNANGQVDPGEGVFVKIVYSYKILTPMPAFVPGIPTKYEMNACTEMRLEQVSTDALAAANRITTPLC